MIASLRATFRKQSRKIWWPHQKNAAPERFRLLGSFDVCSHSETYHRMDLALPLLGKPDQDSLIQHSTRRLTLFEKDKADHGPLTSASATMNTLVQSDKLDIFPLNLVLAVQENIKYFMIAGTR